MSYDPTKLRADLEVDEGRRLTPYRDTQGLLTIGVGHNLWASGISDAVCDLMLQEDIDAAVSVLNRHAAWWTRLPEAPARVLVNLCFNLGWAKLATFRRFLAAMELGDWGSAAEELRDSAWWQEVGERGPRMVARLLNEPQPAGSAGATEQSR